MRTKVMVLVVGVVLAAAGQTVQTLDPGGIQPVYLLASDLNRDGFPDLAVACHSSNSVAVFENTRAPCGVFDGAVQWKLEDSPVALAAGFFLNSVCPIAPQCFHYTSVFPNIVAVTQYQPGLVRFSPVEPKEPFLKLVPGGPIGVAVLPFTTLTHLVVADFDKDGATDVAVLDGISMKIGIYLGARAALYSPIPAQGSTAKPPDRLINLEGEQAYFLGAADFDRDGTLDLVVSVDGNLVFYPGTEGVPTKVKLGKKLVSFALADFNRDGYVDIAVVDPEFGALTVVFNRGCWQFERGPRLKFDGQPVAVVTGDFDRNGLVDLAVAEKEANRVSFVINELANLWEIKRPDPCTHTVPSPEKVDYVGFKVVQVVGVGKNPVALVAEDFDMNGILDVAVAIFGENKVQLIYNPCLCPDCTGKIPCSSPPPTLRGEGLSSPGAAETPKLEAASQPEGSPSPVFVGHEVHPLPLPVENPSAIALGDLNGDGLADLVVADPQGSLYLYKGQGDGSFAGQGDLRWGLQADKLVIADFDGNGLGDILAVNWRTRDTTIFYFKGAFSLGPARFFSAPPLAKDVWAFQLNDSKGWEIVWLTGEKPLVWSVSPQGGFVELAQVPSFLSSLKPLLSPLSSYVEVGPKTVALAHYSTNPGEIFLTQGDKKLVEIRSGTALKAIAAGDINADGIPDLLGLEEGGRVRVWLVGKEAS
ncbi:MAG: FG-GAP repeat domain-containing protein [Candidatus Bipolaricaulaceae bacterium]